MAAEWRDPRCSPHVRQALTNTEAGYSCRTDLPFSRVLGPDSQIAKYRRRTGEVKSVIHWGQRKLLLSEVEFLTLYGSRSDIVVYAGAAPGTHIKMLAELFPSHKFVLVDPAPFTVRESENILCRQEFFSDDVAREFEGKNVLFVSDIRSADWQLVEEDETDRRVRDDQDAQVRWMRIMKPVCSMLKFRLPWSGGRTMYAKGEIRLPIWGPITTTESRLIVEGDAPDVEYDNRLYEEQLFFFNTVTRVALYPHTVPLVDGLDYCYDCNAEVRVWRAYLEMTGDSATDDDIAALTQQASRECAARGRTLANENSDPDERRRGIRGRQWIDGAPAYAPRNDSAPAVDFGKGSKMLQQLGYKEGQGLGAHGQGIAEPIKASKQKGSRGLGADNENVTSKFLSSSSHDVGSPPSRSRDHFHRERGRSRSPASHSRRRSRSPSSRSHKSSRSKGKTNDATPPPAQGGFVKGETLVGGGLPETASSDATAITTAPEAAGSSSST